MLQQIIAVYLREMRILKHRWFKQMLTMSVSPLLYVITFGFGVGGAMTVDGVPYIRFLIPGIVAMNSMTYAYAIASDINISRFYWRVFDEILCSPVTALNYTVGEILYGLTRSLIGVVITLIIGAAFGIFLDMGLYFWLGIIGNALVFCCIAIIASMSISSHADQSMLTSFIITPMAFLSGTFFPVEKMPWIVQKILAVIPLTHAADVIRASALGLPFDLWRLLLLVGLAALLFPFAVRSIMRARE